MVIAASSDVRSGRSAWLLSDAEFPIIPSYANVALAWTDWTRSGGGKFARLEPEENHDAVGGLVWRREDADFVETGSAKPLTAPAAFSSSMRPLP